MTSAAAWKTSAEGGRRRSEAKSGAAAAASRSPCCFGCCGCCSSCTGRGAKGGKGSAAPAQARIRSCAAGQSPSALPTLLAWPTPEGGALAAAPAAGVLRLSPAGPYTTTAAAGCQPAALSCCRRSAMTACKLSRLCLRPLGEAAASAGAAAAGASVASAVGAAALPCAGPAAGLPLLGPAAPRPPGSWCAGGRSSCCRPGRRYRWSSTAAAACRTCGILSYFTYCVTAATMAGAMLSSAATPCSCCCWCVAPLPATPFAAAAAGASACAPSEAGLPPASSVSASTASVSAAALRTCHSLRHSGRQKSAARPRHIDRGKPSGWAMTPELCCAEESKPQAGQLYLIQPASAATQPGQSSRANQPAAHLRCMPCVHSCRTPPSAAALRRGPSRVMHDCRGSSTSPTDRARAPAAVHAQQGGGRSGGQGRARHQRCVRQRNRSA